MASATPKAGSTSSVVPKPRPPAAAPKSTPSAGSGNATSASKPAIAAATTAAGTAPPASERIRASIANAVAYHKRMKDFEQFRKSALAAQKKLSSVLQNYNKPPLPRAIKFSQKQRSFARHATNAQNAYDDMARLILGIESDDKSADAKRAFDHFAELSKRWDERAFEKSSRDSIDTARARVRDLVDGFDGDDRDDWDWWSHKNADGPATPESVFAASLDPLSKALDRVWECVGILHCAFADGSRFAEGTYVPLERLLGLNGYVRALEDAGAKLQQKVLAIKAALATAGLGDGSGYAERARSEASDLLRWASDRADVADTRRLHDSAAAVLDRDAAQLAQAIGLIPSWQLQREQGSELAKAASIDSSTLRVVLQTVWALAKRVGFMHADLSWRVVERHDTVAFSRLTERLSFQLRVMKIVLDKSIASIAELKNSGDASANAMAVTSYAEELIECAQHPVDRAWLDRVSADANELASTYVPPSRAPIAASASAPVVPAKEIDAPTRGAPLRSPSDSGSRAGGSGPASASVVESKTVPRRAATAQRKDFGKSRSPTPRSAGAPASSTASASSSALAWEPEARLPSEVDVDAMMDAASDILDERAVSRDADPGSLAAATRALESLAGQLDALLAVVGAA